MKKISLFILGFLATGFMSFAQLTPDMIPAAEDFVTPANTGSNQTVGINSTDYDVYAGGQIGAFFILEGELSCVGLYDLTVGFNGLALWGDDSSTPEKDGLATGDVPNFFILTTDGRIILVDEIPEFTGYLGNAISLISGGLFTEITSDSYGCADEGATNYDANFVVNDGSCVFVVEGCTDDNYLEYLADANQDDGSCVTPVVSGCIDPSAFNFDPAANTDDGNCEPVVNGCLDPDSQNYNPNANVDPAAAFGATSCIPHVYGCTSDWAENYNDAATADDGSCVLNGCTSDWAENYVANATDDDGSCFLNGCMSDWAENYDSNATDDDGSCFLNGCTSDWAENYDSNATDDDGSCFLNGCTSSWAENYDSNATDDDGSCFLNGCTSSWADNYDSNATDDDGSCTLDACMSDWADNYDPNATSDDGSCYRNGCMTDYMTNYDPIATIDDGSCYREGCMDTGYFEYDPLATQDADLGAPSFCEMLIVEGCFNIIALNYNPDANFGNQADLCEIPPIDPQQVTVTSNNMSVLFPVSTEDIFLGTDLVAGDVIFAAYELSSLEDDAIGYSAVNDIASGGFGVWNDATIGVSVYGADGLEDNGFYEDENLTWLVTRQGVVYEAQVTYALDNPNFENSDASHTVGVYSDGGYIVVNSVYLGSPYYEGCTDPTYFNYNPLAQDDDGSCDGLISFGCADTNYVNYAGLSLDTTLIDVNANNYGNAYGENLIYAIGVGITDQHSNIPASHNAPGMCQTAIEGCTDPMALNYNPKATVNLETECNWTFTPDHDAGESYMRAYDVDNDGNIIQVNYNFGGVDPNNVNDGFINSQFHFAQKFTAEGPDQVFSPTDHVIDALAEVLEWIEDDETADSLKYKTSIDSAAVAFAADEAADEALLAQTIADAEALLTHTLDSAATAFAEDEAADEALLASTLDSANTAHVEYVDYRDSLFNDMEFYLSDSITRTLDSAATAFAEDEAADSALLAQTIAAADALLAQTIADAEALLAQTIADAEALLTHTLDSAATAFAEDEAFDDALLAETQDSLNYHRDAIIIDLVDGWNTIGYYLQYPSSVIAQFNKMFPLGNGNGPRDHINIVKDNVGNFWWPDFQFDGLGDLIPGQGYQVRVKDNMGKSDFIFTHGVGESADYRTLDPTVPQWAIDMPVDVHPNDVRTLIRVVNMLGQEVRPENQFKGEVLLYLYNDGTVEKKIVQ